MSVVTISMARRLSDSTITPRAPPMSCARFNAACTARVSASSMPIFSAYEAPKAPASSTHAIPHRPPPREASVAIRSGRIAACSAARRSCRPSSSSSSRASARSKTRFDAAFPRGAKMAEPRPRGMRPKRSPPPAWPVTSNVRPWTAWTVGTMFISAPTMDSRAATSRAFSAARFAGDSGRGRSKQEERSTVQPGSPGTSTSSTPTTAHSPAVQRVTVPTATIAQ